MDIAVEDLVAAWAKVIQCCSSRIESLESAGSKSTISGVFKGVPGASRVSLCVGWHCLLIGNVVIGIVLGTVRERNFCPVSNSFAGSGRTYDYESFVGWKVAWRWSCWFRRRRYVFRVVGLGMGFVCGFDKMTG